MTTLMEALRALPQEVRFVRVDVDGLGGRVTAPLPEGQITIGFEFAGKTDTYAIDGKVVRLARALPPEATADKVGARFRINSGSGAYSFSLMPAETVPAIAEPQSWAVVPLTGEDLRKALVYVRTAAAVDDIRYYLNGVLIRIEAGLEAVASNGHVAAIATEKTTGTAEGASIILPNKCVAEIIRLLGADDDGNAVIETGRRETGGTMLRVRVGQITYIAMGIEGTYPEFQLVFAANEAVATARFDADAIGEAVKRLELTVQAKRPTLMIAIGDGGVKLSSTADPDKDGSEAVSAAEVFSGRIECGINPYYLADAIEAARAEHHALAIGWVDAEKALTVCPLAEEGVMSTKKWIVMPLRT